MAINADFERVCWQNYPIYHCHSCQNVVKMHKNQTQPLTVKNLPPCHFVLQCPIIFIKIYQKR